MCKYSKFLTDLGFMSVAKAPKTSKPKHIKAFTYEELDAPTIRATLGRSKAHAEGRFAFVLSKTQGVFVSTSTHKVLLCNGADAVKLMLQSVNNRKESA